MRTKEQNKKLHFLLGKTGLMGYKPEFAFAYSEGRTDQTSLLTVWECDRLINDLEKKVPNWENDPKNQKRRRIFHLAHELAWELPSGAVDIERLSKWLESDKAKVKKPLNKQNASELSTTIFQMEQMLKKEYEN